MVSRPHEDYGVGTGPTHLIRVNTLHPGVVNTDLIENRATYDLFAPDIPDATCDQVAPRFQTLSALPTPWIEPRDVSNAVLFVASDEARYVTGSTSAIDAGALTL
jgi:(+)-trans-carveol dehydrogenase